MQATGSSGEEGGSEGAPGRTSEGGAASGGAGAAPCEGGVVDGGDAGRRGTQPTPMIKSAGTKMRKRVFIRYP